jgi:predicted O-methyltransferase YrrM
MASLRKDLARLHAKPSRRVFPSNPVVLRLIEEGRFEHGGRSYPVRSNFGASLSATMGQMILAKGFTRILEIGTLYGFATLHLAEAAKAIGGRVVTVDKRPTVSKLGEDQVPGIHFAAERFVGDSNLSDFVTFEVGNSSEVLPRLIRRGDRFDCALIDGSHNYPTAFLDFLNVDALLAKGGVVFLDDIGSKHASRDELRGGPQRFLAHVFASSRYEIVPLSANAAACKKLVDLSK